MLFGLTSVTEAVMEAPAPESLDVPTQEADDSVVVLHYADLLAGRDLTKDIARAFGEGSLGICAVRGVPGLQDVRSRLLPLARELALLPPDTLERYELSNTSYCVGWSRGREKFQGKPDTMKGSYYGNPIFEDPSEGDEAVREKYPYGATPNVWPEEIPALKRAFTEMGHVAYNVAQLVVRQCDKLVRASHEQHGSRLYHATFTNSRMVAGRLLHYYAPEAPKVADAGVQEPSTDSQWCGWHNDNSVLTALVPAMWLNERTGRPAPAAALTSTTGGLYVRGRSGTIRKVSLPPDCLGFQTGEAAQILSGGILRATPHCVRGHTPRPGEEPLCRETFALFMEPQWDAAIGPPRGVGYDAVLRDDQEDEQLIPPLAKRMRIDEPAGTVDFGRLLHESFMAYYRHNNPGDEPQAADAA